MVITKSVNCHHFLGETLKRLSSCSRVLAEFILKNSRPLRILCYCCFIGRDDVKGGLDNNGSGGGEDVVEVGEVEPAVACSTLARF